jgi:hypothetical protein
MSWFTKLFSSKEEAIVQVETTANPEWKAEALEVIERLATIHHTFTTDAVWALVKSETHEPRAMGAVMRIATKNGIVAPTDVYTPSMRKVSHHRPVRVWQSLIKEAK